MLRSRCATSTDHAVWLAPIYAFEQKPNLKLIDMPRFPSTEGMSREEKFTSVTVYLAKVVDHLQGEPDEYTYPIRRPDLHRAGSRSLPENFKVQDLLPNISEEISSSEVGEERTSKGIGSSKVAGTTDGENQLAI